jgi:branched-chain amino acid transport system substrate-binding protein
MTTTRRSTLRLMAGTAGAGLALGLFARPGAAQATDFKIGVVASLTGPAAPFFREYADGFRAYATHWNARGGVNGRKIALTFVDDESGAVQAVNGYRRVAGDPETMVAWVAGVSAGGLAIKAVASEIKLPIVSGGALDSLGVPAEPYYFKIAPANRDFLKLFVDWVKQRNFKKIAIIGANDAYGQAEQAVLKELAAAAGVQIAAFETFAVTDTNFSAQLVRLRSTRPDLVYLSATGAPAILIYKQFKQLGLKFPLCMLLSALTESFYKAIGGASEADGVFAPSLLGMLGDKANGPSAALFKQLTEVLGRPASLGNSLGWDIGLVTEAAIKNSDGSRQGIRDALDKIKELPAINGPVTYTPDNHIGQDARGLAMVRLSGGKFLPADES